MSRTARLFTRLQRPAAILGATAAATLVMIEPALAGGDGGFGAVFARLSEQLDEVKDFIAIGAFVGGLGIGATGLVKFKKHAENPNAVPLSQPLVRVIVGAMLIALPSVLGVGIGSFFGGDGENLGIEGGADEVQPL